MEQKNISNVSISICPRCQQKIIGDNHICPNCGYENNLAEAKFCANCSQKFDRSELDE